MRKKLSILGSTGSIGTSTLDICRRHPDRFSVAGLAAGENTELLIRQVLEFRPRVVSVSSDAERAVLQGCLPPGVEVFCGAEGARTVASLAEADLVMSSIVGAAGFGPTLAAIQAKKTVALANKESMVIGGEFLSRLARQNGVKIIPVDSEHSAIFQCLNGEHPDDVARLMLTASGGPFFNRAAETFKHITQSEALRHPNWKMGKKVTIDSATMMNKGLEVIEAHWLFDLPVQKIEVVVHPQSVVHSMVEFVDGSVMAQMGEPDMRVPIAYALSHPRRIPTGVKKLNLTQREQLTFFKPDEQKFPCLTLACQAARQGKTFPAVLNAANEEAVLAFLGERIRFDQIASLLEACLAAHQPFEVNSVEDVFAADCWAREQFKNLVQKKRISA